MTTKRVCTAGVALSASAALLFAGCAGNPEPTASTTTATPQGSASASFSASTAPAAPTTSTAAASPASSKAQSKAVPSFTSNVPPPDQQRPDNPIKHPMNPDWEKQALQQISAYTGVPADQYAGLDAAKTFIASNDSGFTYWAGTAVMPGDSAEAKKSVEGAGSYFLIHYDQHKNFDVFPVGKAGYDEPNRCAATKLPDSIRQLWGWAPTDCPPF